ncbi:chemotaxis-specific protein-glutamate methyltransferase CheB [Piscinibacter sp.]|uniref:chemotaxis-specific protein-glutamate methyltransferase CheB n=1 Tax=Piscinibacter sp. TaxID=1903157 RepID=UPI002B7B8778|nr:chemotaxis-specific protein-glutamate methyltransferase CheB [Albitalea sp.]HUG24031.1 chemotaxis-specific protein-glutamate methyltransferase CheB [Albitalea sp.]
MTGPVVRVLVVEDSAASRELLVGIINADPKLQVVGIAADGQTAVAAAERIRPDVITMDIHLPVLDGFGATRRIMQTCPTRIVMVTSSSIPNDVEASFEALACGALSVLAKPPGPGHPDFAALREELVRTVKLMAEVPVVRRWPAATEGVAAAPVPAQPPGGVTHDVVPRLVAIGASTGGPLALQAILSRLRPDFGVPVVIVQHISLGFAEGFVQWLAHSTGFRVRVAAHGDRMQPGIAYVAPDGAQLKLRDMAHLQLVNEPHENGFRPSVAALFRSVAHHFGRHAVGVLLTGMGNDGAKELKAMREVGALTLVQDMDSAVIYGMPGEAVRLGAATHVLSPATIAVALNRLVPS